MNYLQQNDWLICHAAALEANNGAMAIAGFSGGGKSTFMLHLLREAGMRFISNDRLFVKPLAGQLQVRGVPGVLQINGHY